MKLKNCSVLVIGEGKLISGIVICLLEANHRVFVWDTNNSGMSKVIEFHFSNDIRMPLLLGNFIPITHLEEINEVELAVGITGENLEKKLYILNMLEKAVSDTCLIAMNMESMSLDQIQEKARIPNRVVGLNWAEPANVTFFLEIICNNIQEEEIEGLVKIAEEDWKKYPYLLKNGRGIRARMLAAMVREAFYLVENEYVKIEDIDRACRNDAGYYLPFAGNCRYMDLMGTYLYGIVMKDLNPELSNAKELPQFFKEIILQGENGMENKKGFYTYEQEEIDRIHKSFKEFSCRIRELISKYPFDHMEREKILHNNKI